jgi:hypothetical protein
MGPTVGGGLADPVSPQWSGAGPGDACSTGPAGGVRPGGRAATTMDAVVAACPSGVVRRPAAVEQQRLHDDVERRPGWSAQACLGQLQRAP